MGKDKPPAPMVVKTKSGLRAVDSEDAQAILSDPMGAEYDLVKRSKRRWKQLRTYWKALGLVVQNDERWATSGHLHDDLKLSCGYVRKAIDLNTGDQTLVVDSIAFDKMTQPEFQEYMNKAMMKLTLVVYYDPLEFLNEG